MVNLIGKAKGYFLIYFSIGKLDFLFFSFCTGTGRNSTLPAAEEAGFGQGDAGFVIYGSRRFHFYGWRREKREAEAAMAAATPANSGVGGGYGEAMPATFRRWIGWAKRGEREYSAWRIRFYLQFQRICDVCDEFGSSINGANLGFRGFFLR